MVNCMIRKEKLKELESYINELKTLKLEEIDCIGKGFLEIRRYSCSLNNEKTINHFCSIEKNYCAY